MDRLPAPPSPSIPALTWPTPSEKSLHSLPLGNGEIGINVWVEPPGELVFYIARTDAWSEHARLLKLGRVRLSLDPAPFAAEPYRETLDLQTASVEVSSGKPGAQVAARIWVDANHPVIRIEVTADQPIRISAKVELWRTEPRELTQEELYFGLQGGPRPLIESADIIAPPRGERLIWFHRNEDSIWSENLELQNLQDLMTSQQDPLLHRTFGCAMAGAGLRPSGNDTLQSEEARRNWTIEICTHTAISPTVEDWVNGLEEQIPRAAQIPAETARRDHLAWWKEFWERSWIHLSGSPEAELVGQAYQLQRYYLACAGRGNFPIKFNGSLFTIESGPLGAAALCGKKDYPEVNADYRRWGGGYWFQNTRLAYWPMLASGDTTMMRTFFRLFAAQLPLARLRCKKYFGHEGAYFGETQNFWGGYQNYEFGWDGNAAKTGEIQSPFLRWHLNGNLELLALMLSYYDHTGDAAFARQELIPMAIEILRFFDLHYPRDKNGRMRIEPGQSLETYWEAINNTPDVAGLHDVLDRLLALPNELKQDAPAEDWQRLRQELPEIPMEDAIGPLLILPAEKFGKMTNYENPELYALFPFRVFGVGRPRLEAAQNSFRARRHQRFSGWSQDEIHAACSGLAQEARAGLVTRFATRGYDNIAKKFGEEIARFPAVWGPNFDWMPDMDHGCSAMIALQLMLLQTHGDTLHVLPAWPAEWNVDFKLWAPGETVVSGSVHNGKLEELAVAPTSETRKVIVHEAQPAAVTSPA